MKILLTGKNGQLGFELIRALAPLGEVVAIGTDDCDFTNPSALTQIILKHSPQIIVNPAAYTAVDKAESEQEKALSINTNAPQIIANIAKQLNALFVHYSTDYVFDGTAPNSYGENDITKPINFYGHSKAQGEQNIINSGAKFLLFRTSWVAGVHGNNFIKTTLNLAKTRENINVVNDQVGAPTSANLIANTTALILHQYINSPTKLPFGLYNLTASGYTTWFEYAQLIVSFAKEQKIPLKLNLANITPVTSEQYLLPAKRPKNSRLDTTLIQKTFNIKMPNWQDGVIQILQSIIDK